MITGPNYDYITPESLHKYFVDITKLFEKFDKEFRKQKAMLISIILAYDGKAEKEAKLHYLTLKRTLDNLDKLHIIEKYDGFVIEWRHKRHRQLITNIDELINLLNNDNTNTALKDSEPA